MTRWLSSQCIGILALFVVSGSVAAQGRAEDAAVYATVLDSLYGRSREPRLILAERTESRTRGERLPEPYRSRYLTALGLDESTLAGFEQATRTRHIVAPAPTPGKPVEVLSDSALGSFPTGRLHPALTDSAGAELSLFWRAFHKRYPDVSGYVTLSPVGYSRAGEQAIVETAWYCGTLCAEGHQVVLVRREGRWYVTSVTRTWIS